MDIKLIRFDEKSTGLILAIKNQMVRIGNSLEELVAVEKAHLENSRNSALDEILEVHKQLMTQQTKDSQKKTKKSDKKEGKK